MYFLVTTGVEKGRFGFLDFVSLVTVIARSGWNSGTPAAEPAGHSKK